MDDEEKKLELYNPILLLKKFFLVLFRESGQIIKTKKSKLIADKLINE